MAARLKAILMLLVLPAVFLATGFFFVKARGPFYHGAHYDPEYAYLFNALNLLSGEPPRHIDHPGVPAQVLLAGVIKGAHPMKSSDALNLEVISDPEQYLGSASTILIFSHLLAMVAWGILIWERTGRVADALIVQATPFLLGANFLLYFRVNPEPVLLWASSGLAVILVARSSERRSRAEVVALAFLAAMGLTAKITFLPAALFPFLALSTVAERVRYAVWAAVFTLLWTLPISGAYGEFLAWVWRLLTHTGQYGRGDIGIAEPAAYLTGLGRLLRDNPIYTGTWLAGLAAVIGLRPPGPSASGRGEWRFLRGLLVCEGLQLLLSAKDPQSRYLAPAAGLLGFHWLAMVSLWRLRRPAGGALARAAWALAGAGAVILCVWHAQLYRRTRETTRQRKALIQAVDAAGTCARVYAYGASSPVYALVFGSSFAGERFEPWIRLAVLTGGGKSYFLNQWTGKLFSFEGEVDLRQVLGQSSCVILQGDRDAARHWAREGISFRLLAEAGTEAAYRADRDRSPVAALSQ